MSSVHESKGPDTGTSSEQSSTCNSELKLGDTCDSCFRGTMLPPGGLEYYENELAHYGYLRHPIGQHKIKCKRCGHWHTSLGLDYRSGFDPV